MMTIEQRIAWIHKDAISLQTNDLVALKYNLRRIIDEATAACAAVKQVLQDQRSSMRQAEDGETVTRRVHAHAQEATEMQGEKAETLTRQGEQQR